MPPIRYGSPGDPDFEFRFTRTAAAHLRVSTVDITVHSPIYSLMADRFGLLLSPGVFAAPHPAAPRGSSLNAFLQM